MKKIIAIVALIAVAVGGYFVFFNGKNDDKLETVKVQLIPSADPSAVQKAAKKLEPILDKELKKQKINGYKKVEITVASDYKAAISSLQSQAVQLAAVTGPDRDDLKRVVQAQRTSVAGDEAKTDGSPITNDEKTVLNNWKKSGIKLSTDSKQIATFYRSAIWVKKGSDLEKDFLAAFDKQGANWKLNWSDYKAKIKIAYSSTISEASYIKLEKWLQKHFKGFQSINKSIDKANQQKANGSADQVQKLVTGQITLTAHFSSLLTTKPVMDTLGSKVNDLSIVGAGEEIQNDGLSTYPELNAKLKEKLGNALVNTLKTPEGKDAWAVYNYTGFMLKK